MPNPINNLVKITYFLQSRVAKKTPLDIDMLSESSVPSHSYFPFFRGVFIFIILFHFI